MESQLKLQSHLRQFAKRVSESRELFANDLNQGIEDLIRKNGYIYEEDLCQLVFGAEYSEQAIEHRFLTHKFLLESPRVIKDSQWSLSTSVGTGPYIKRRPSELHCLALAQKANFELFRSKMGSILDGHNCDLSDSEMAIIKCLAIYADDFYLNCQSPVNEFKVLLESAFLGISFVDSQAEARRLFELISRTISIKLDEGSIISRPFKTSKEFSSVKSDRSSGISPLIKTSRLESRSSFENLTVWAVDPEGTTEVDDGISVQSISDKSAKLFVHVADPTDLLTEHVDKMALVKAETLYLPEAKSPMLPASICNAASLRTTDNDDKRSSRDTLTFSCVVDLESGEISDLKYERGAIAKIVNVSYETAEKMMASVPDLQVLQSIAIAHYHYRCRKGHFDLRFPKGYAKIHNGNLVSIEKDTLSVGSMRQIISEAMIIAGRVAAELLCERKQIAPFRYHPGFPVNSDTEALLCRDPSTLALHEKFVLLKNLPSAAIDIQPRPHLSMGLDAYLKVTSPLRRYLDLYTHRILLQSPPPGVFEFLSKNLYSIFRQEQYLKRLRSSANRFWIDKYLRSSSKDAVFHLCILQHNPENIKHPEDTFIVHVNEIASNFIPRIRSSGQKLEVGQSIRARLSNATDSIVIFEVIN